MEGGNDRLAGGSRSGRDQVVMVRKEVSKFGIRWLPSPSQVVGQSSEAAIDHPGGVMSWRSVTEMVAPMGGGWSGGAAVWIELNDRMLGAGVLAS